MHHTALAKFMYYTYVCHTTPPYTCVKLLHPNFCLLEENEVLDTLQKYSAIPSKCAMQLDVKRIKVHVLSHDLSMPRDKQLDTEQQMCKPPVDVIGRHSSIFKIENHVQGIKLATFDVGRSQFKLSYPEMSGHQSCKSYIVAFF